MCERFWTLPDAGVDDDATILPYLYLHATARRCGASRPRRIRHDHRPHEAGLLSLSAVRLRAERSSPIQQQRARDAVPPRGRRDRSWRLHALRNNLEFLLIGPAPPPTGFNNAEPFKLSTALIAVHKDCYTALNQIRQGGLHRRKTMNRARDVMKWTPILGPEAKLEKGRSV